MIGVLLRVRGGNPIQRIYYREAYWVFHLSTKHKSIMEIQAHQTSNQAMFEYVTSDSGWADLLRCQTFLFYLYSVNGLWILIINGSICPNLIFHWWAKLPANIFGNLSGKISLLEKNPTVRIGWNASSWWAELRTQMQRSWHESP